MDRQVTAEDTMSLIEESKNVFISVFQTLNNFSLFHPFS